MMDERTPDHSTQVTLYNASQSETCSLGTCVTQCDDMDSYSLQFFTHVFVNTLNTRTCE